MADIAQLTIGTEVTLTFTDGTRKDGKVTGRVMGGAVEGYVDLVEHLPRGELHPDRVRVTFPTIGVPPETVSVSCEPARVALLWPNGRPGDATGYLRSNPTDLIE